MDRQAVGAEESGEVLRLAHQIQGVSPFALPDLVEKLPGVGFIEERPFGIISTVMKPVGHECG